MFMRKTLAVVALAAPLAFVACGGGEKQEAPAAAPATTQAAAPGAGAAGGATRTRGGACAGGSLLGPQECAIAAVDQLGDAVLVEPPLLIDLGPAGRGVGGSVPDRG